jgi:glucan 1,4-alpha-glucosidase
MMMKRLLFILLLSGLATTSFADQQLTAHSPDGNIQLGIFHRTNGDLFYSVFYKGKTVIALSGLGMKLKSPELILAKFDLLGIDSSVTNETWKPVWGEVNQVRNHYKQLVLKLTDRSGSGIQLQLIFKVFNDGVGFRYSFPQQDKLNHFIIGEELTQFAMSGDHKAFWIPGDYDTNEFMYNTTFLSGVDASSGGAAAEIHAKTFFDRNAVQTPLMLKSADGLYINIHEAALVNYPAMNLVVNKSILAGAGCYTLAYNCGER